MKPAHHAAVVLRALLTEAQYDDTQRMGTHYENTHALSIVNRLVRIIAAGGTPALWDDIAESATWVASELRKEM